ncbi:MAG: hypothetical protein WAN35_00500 [Terracidiphilus sp.]
MLDLIATAGKSDILSNLTAELEKIEKKHIKSHCDKLVQARTDLANALHGFTCSRFDVGKILFEYRGYYKLRHGWVDAAEAIGNAINRNKRTIYRMVRDYEIATQISPLLLNVLAEMDIDPTRAQYLKLAQLLLKIKTPSSSEDAEKKVKEALAKVAETGARKNSAAKPKSLDDFTNQIVDIFVGRYGAATPKECRNEVRDILNMIVAALGPEISDLRTIGHQELPPKSNPDVQIPKAVMNASKSVKSRPEELPLFADLYANTTDVAA